MNIGVGGEGKGQMKGAGAGTEGQWMRVEDNGIER